MTASTEKIRGWLSGRLPEDLFEHAPELTVDRDEILIVGQIPAPSVADGASDEERSSALAGKIREFRERTRDQRIDIALELERATRRKVSWGVTCGDRRELFTTLAAPAMTRLRMSERQVLDTLVDSGVARSRSEALAWCVKLVGKHSEQWLGELREAMGQVAQVRDRGPDTA